MSPLNTKPIKLTHKLTVHAPLSRRGHGPGIIIIRTATTTSMQNQSATLDPEPLQKWAEEGYAVVQVTVSSNCRTVKEDLRQAIDALNEHEKCDKKIYGVMG